MAGITDAARNAGEPDFKRRTETVGHKNRDFWHLYRLKMMPEETREYAPAVIAAAIVFGNPLHYGGPSLPAGQ